MKIAFLKPAETELNDAFEYYETVQDGLGFRIQAEVAKSLSRAIEYPMLYQKIGKYLHRCLLHKFPYGVIYQYKENRHEILAVAIANLHRKPDYWFSRES